MLQRTRKTYIVSDLHFDHANIVRYCNRPYHVEPPNSNPINKPAVEAMNEDILKQFDRLPEDCDIWNLGDVFFAGSRFKDYRKPEKIAELKDRVARMKQGNRKLFLVLGNHDDVHMHNKDRIEYYYDLGFDKIYDTPVIVEDKYILSHEPLYIKPGSNFINLYGHTHDLAIQEDYFCYDYENYAMECRVFDKAGQERPPIQKRYPDRIIDLKNYKNVCLDHNNGILEWTGDYFKQATLCWPNKEEKNENEKK